MSRHHRVAALTATAAALVVLTGCSSSSDPKSSTSPSAPDTASASSATSSTAAGSTTAESTTAAAADGLESTLLTATDIGSGYQTAPTGTTDSPLPCTPAAKPLFLQAPPAQKVEKSFANTASTVQVGETVAEFGEATGAQQAFTIAVKGFACSQGTLGSQQVRIVKRSGTKPTGKVDQVAVWDFAAGQQKGTAVIARIDDHIAGLTFFAVGTAGDAVPVGTIVNRALAKVAAHD